MRFLTDLSDSLSESEPVTLVTLDFGRLGLPLAGLFFLSCFFDESDKLFRLMEETLAHRAASSSEALLFFLFSGGELSSSLDDTLSLDFLSSLVGTTVDTLVDRRSLSESLCDLESLSFSLVLTVSFDFGGFFLPEVLPAVLVLLLGLLFFKLSSDVRWRFGLLFDFLGRPRFLVSVTFGFSVWERLSSIWRTFSWSEWWSLSLRELIWVLFKGSSSCQSWDCSLCALLFSVFISSVSSRLTLSWKNFIVIFKKISYTQFEFI